MDLGDIQKGALSMTGVIVAQHFCKRHANTCGWIENRYLNEDDFYDRGCKVPSPIMNHLSWIPAHDGAKSRLSQILGKIDRRLARELGLPPLVKRAKAPSGTAPKAAPTASAWGLHREGRREMVIVVDQGHRAVISAPELVRLFTLVANQGDRDVPWGEMSRAIVAQGKTTGFALATLKRNGRRIRTLLGPLRWHWLQDGAGVRWAGPSRNDAATP